MGEKISIRLPEVAERTIGPVKLGERSARIAEIIRRYGDIVHETGLADDDTLPARIREIAERYSLLCAFERPYLEEAFSEAELNALADAIRSTAWVPASTIINGIWDDFQDSAPDGLREKWHVDPKAVSAKLLALSVGQQIALVELLEQRKRRMAEKREES